MMPQRAERSISEKVAGSASLAPFESLCSSSRRIDRIWWRSRDLRRRFTTVFRLVWRMRFSDEIVFAILVQITEYLKSARKLKPRRTRVVGPVEHRPVLGHPKTDFMAEAHTKL